MSRSIRRSYLSFSLGLIWGNLSIHCYQWGTDLSKPLIDILVNLTRSYNIVQWKSVAVSIRFAYCDCRFLFVFFLFLPNNESLINYLFISKSYVTVLNVENAVPFWLTTHTYTDIIGSYWPIFKCLR